MAMLVLCVVSYWQVHGPSQDPPKSSSCIIDDDMEARGRGGFDAVFPEDRKWYPARVVSRSFRVSKVEFVGYEEDGEYEVRSEDIRPSLSDIFILVSTSSADETRLRVQVEADATVEELKRHVEARLQTPSTRVRLIYQGRELTDPTCRLYSDCSIRTNSTLHLSVKHGDEDGEDGGEKFAVRARGAGGGDGGDFPALMKRPTSHQLAHKKKNQKAKSASKRGAGDWWSSLDGDDVISLDPLCDLSYEPFFLPANAGDEPADRGRAGWVDSYNFFDGKVLSRYLVSTGNFSHPVSRRSLGRAECVRLDGYMEKNGFGEAGVVHAFDLKDDKTDNGRNHLEALQREAESILQSLFSNAQRDYPSRRHSQPRPRRVEDSLSLAAPPPLRQDVVQSRIVDDDEEAGIVQHQQMMQESWPELPRLQHRSKPEMVHAPADFGSTRQGEEEGEEVGAGEEEVEAFPSEPSEPWAEQDDATVVDISRISWPWRWTASATSAIKDVEDPGLQVLLERQMGGAARDFRFEEEISFIEHQLQQATSCGRSLVELGFQVKRVCVLQSSEVEEKFAGSVRSLQFDVWAREGWREEACAQGPSGGRKFFWNAETRESRWTPPALPALEGLEVGGSEAEGEQEGGAGWQVCVGGFPAVMSWRTMSSDMLKGIKKGAKKLLEEVRREDEVVAADLLDDLDQASLEKGGSQLVCTELPAALALAARRAGLEVEGVEDIDEGAELSLLLGLSVLGEEDRDWSLVADPSNDGLRAVQLRDHRWTLRRFVVTVCRLEGATIRYTMDGSDPLNDEQLETGRVQSYDRPFILGQGTFNIRAVAMKLGMADSLESRALYIVKARCAPPCFSPNVAELCAGNKISMSTRTWEVLPDAKIHFTLEKVEEPQGDGGQRVRARQGFFQEPLVLHEEGVWSIRAVTMHTSMLPSESSSVRIVVRAREERTGTSEEQPAGSEQRAPVAQQGGMGRRWSPVTLSLVVAVFAALVAFFLSRPVT
ncbi:hypothetical protein GUITHDRAFT_100678 [Guillardia theta CCMP2712]|uniref:Ubiquitin-like domain-containing protein n=2 Tax=Guillardia theta TaxID=55529 RepID=L1JZH3_GUITC|nr:hypothetical protein GUITHDRAFT_100678 [Guillardia theta CCMP2712]EKX53704.1 hypothetical protein GUITHDRAFT_100678 [Guillardia theta CCMP2712]|eukprot:XP_005840684.1 hypothetical protein GUITHDRAFT_100678 [Guillardia theta CCMP2712]